jgi:hypothetical protein
VFAPGVAGRAPDGDETMKRLLHRYIRRFIRWIDTPSDEEMAARRRENITRQAQEERVERIVMSAAPFAPLPNTYAPIRNLWDLKRAGDIINRLKTCPTFKQDHLDAHLQAIKDTANAMHHLKDGGLGHGSEAA